MNSFSSSEISNLFTNRFRLEEKHTPQYLAECFQRLCPSLQRQNTSSLADSVLQANSRGFKDGKPVKGEDLNLSFFWQEWKRNIRLNVQDPFAFNDELKLAYSLDTRGFWDVIIGAEREVGTLLRDGFELMGYRELPKEILLNLRVGSGSVDSAVIRKIKDILRPRLSVVSLQDFAKALLQVFEQSSPSSSQVKELAERIARDNGIRQNSSEPLTLVPVSRLDSISTKCMED